MDVVLGVLGVYVCICVSVCVCLFFCVYVCLFVCICAFVVADENPLPPQYKDVKEFKAMEDVCFVTSQVRTGHTHVLVYL